MGLQGIIDISAAQMALQTCHCQKHICTSGGNKKAQVYDSIRIQLSSYAHTQDQRCLIAQAQLMNQPKAETVCECGWQIQEGFRSMRMSTTKLHKLVPTVETKCTIRYPHPLTHHCALQAQHSLSELMELCIPHDGKSKTILTVSGFCIPRCQ